MRRRRAILWWAIPGLLVVVGGVVAVVKSKPSHSGCCPHDAPAAASSEAPALPPGHPEISGMPPHAAKPLTPEQAAAGECPFMKSSASGNHPKT